MQNELSSDDRIVSTYYFSWYDVTNDEHITVGDGRDYLSIHPTPYCLGYDQNPDYRLRKRAVMNGSPTLSYMNAAWHYEELTRMANIGVDVCFFDYWHFPDGVAPNSRASLQILASVLNDCSHLPQIAMFIETVPFGPTGGLTPNLDLTTVEGGDRLFSCVDAFFSIVPPHAVAKIGGRALAMFYTSSIDGMVPAARGLHRCKNLFREKYGYGITLIGNNSWKAKCGPEIGYTCAWGAARRANRLQLDPDFAQIGTGYNYRGDSKGTPPSPQKYKEAWQILRKSHKRFVALETWNEFHEATGIAPTLEYGNQFMDIAQANIAKFKKGL